MRFYKLRKKKVLLALIISLTFIVSSFIIYYSTVIYRYEGHEETGVKSWTKLPEPEKVGDMSVEEAIATRRSVRDYANKPLKLKQLSQLLWAAQGITDPSTGKRAAPSAGALYPFEIYIVVGDGGVEELTAAVYHYNPYGNLIFKIKDGDFRVQLSDAAVYQIWIADAPIIIILVAVYERTTWKYGERGIQYVHMEAGHIGENLYLQATALRLGMVVVGAFLDEEVQKILDLPEDQKPLYIIPIGHPK